MKTLKATLSQKEIIEKLKWFHGEDFTKYPLDETLADFEQEDDF